MKNNKLTLLIFLFLCCSGISKTFAQSLISAGGEEHALLSWTIGEVISGDYSDSKMKVNQGFLFLNDSPSTGLEDIKLGGDDIYAYPNPVNDVFHLIMPPVELETVYMLYDLNGTLVKQGNIEQDNTAVSISDLSQGIYFCKIFLPDFQLIKTLKITKL